MIRTASILSLAALLAASLSLPAAAQTTVAASARPLAANIVIPQSRAWNDSGRAAIAITKIQARVEIVDRAASTTLTIHLANHSSRRQEAELLVPVPAGSAVRGFAFQGSASEPTARLLPRDEARRIYDSIVARYRDPALLEFAGYNLVRSSVFPVEPGGTQTVRLTYEHLLEADGQRVDYVLPRSENVGYDVPWEIAVQVKSGTEIATVYSPSHALTGVTRSAKRQVIKVSDESVNNPGPFRLSYLKQDDGVTASLLAYPDAKTDGGYFLLLAGLPADVKHDSSIKREVTLVLDRSGSMNGPKLQQARDAALQVLAGLEDGEAFNIITYNERAEMFQPAPVIVNQENVAQGRAYLDAIKARGGTNLHDALFEALRQKPTGKMLPLVLFLTDGLPTVGETSEVAIRNVAMQANPHGRRVFTFGVGVDVNTPLLEKIASETRAVSTFVLPEEDVEVKVSGVFKRLAGPILAEPKLSQIDAAGKPAAARVRDVLPDQLPDLFDGDQLVLLGRYTGSKPLRFELAGNYLGRQRKFRFEFPLERATTRNAFVPRLWASRQIAVLIDAIRQNGAGGPPQTEGTAGNDPNRELVDEIVRLSTEFGILTEYTAFLAREGVDLSNRGEVLAEAGYNLKTRAIDTRVGIGSVNQELNNVYQKQQKCLNPGNAYWDVNMNRVAITTVQQIHDKAFYRRGGRWVDAELVQNEDKIEPRRTIAFGSPEFSKLAARLAGEGRQGCISLAGDVLLVVDGQPVLVQAPPQQRTAVGDLRHFPQDVKSVEAFLGHEFKVGEVPVQPTKEVSAEQLRKFLGQRVSVTGTWNPGRREDVEGNGQQPLAAPILPTQRGQVVRGGGIQVERIELADEPPQQERQQIERTR